jgi:hypothetical protein
MENMNNYSFNLINGEIDKGDVNYQILNSFPFCFSNDDISKPPIFVFPKFFNLDNWDSIISNEDVLKNKYVDNVVLIRNKPNYEVVKGDTNLDGKNEIIIKDNVFIIKSNSEGEVDVIYLEPVFMDFSSLFVEFFLPWRSAPCSRNAEVEFRSLLTIVDHAPTTQKCVPQSIAWLKP